MDEQVEREMPKYRSHKQVWALEIASVGDYEVGSNTRQLTFKDAEFSPINVRDEMFLRYVPIPGDFYVAYEDGYKSFSPRKAFLEGYTRE